MQRIETYQTNHRCPHCHKEWGIFNGGAITQKDGRFSRQERNENGFFVCCNVEFDVHWRTVPPHPRETAHARNLGTGDVGRGD